MTDLPDEATTAALRGAVARVIPGDAERGLPGADDPAIFAQILHDVVPILPRIREFLADSAEGLDAPTLRERHPDAATALQEVVVYCTYRDPRVLKHLHMEARAPFPKGFNLDQGDLDLLDAVRDRGPIWRETP